LSEPALKPWSMCDDDVEASGISTSMADNAGQSHSVAIANERDEHAGHRSKLTGLSPFWAIGPLAAALVAAVYSLDGAVGNLWASWTIISLLSASIILLVVCNVGRRLMLSRMLSGIQTGSTNRHETLSPALVSADLQPIWQAVEEHVSSVERRLSQMLDSERQLSMELTLATAQKQLTAWIFSALPDPVLVLDSYGQIIQTNTAAEEMFGFTAEECLRKPIESLALQDDLIKAIRQAREADHRAAERRVEFALGERDFSAHIFPLAHRDKSDTRRAGHGLMVLLRDVTRERDASKKKSEFVAHVAHELRTPLASIRAYVEMLVDGEAADEKTRKEYYEIIDTSAERLGRLIDNMLNISRIEAGTVRINKEPIAVAMVVKEACDMMRPSAEERKIELTEQLTPVMYQTLADRDLLYQSVLNLISNAVKYTPEGGQVNVRMTPREENSTILIEVQDTGVGIPKEDLPKMFQKFFRVEANKSMAKGTGLGLNLVKNIVESIHGGQITLASEVGKGSTFGMILPLMR